jgi:hypothetical protein
VRDEPAYAREVEVSCSCGTVRGAGNDGPVSTATASSFLNAAGTMGG